MTITAIDAGALDIRDGRERRLGFPTGISPRRFRSADTVALKSSGFLVDAQGRIESWPVDRFVEYQETMVAVGPWVEGSRPLIPDELAPLDLKRLIPAIRALGAAGFPLGGLFLPAFRRLPDGGFLVFPPKLAAWMRDLVPENRRHQDWDRWIHPDIGGESAWSFTLGVLAWRMVSDVDPFAEEREDHRRERIRRGALPPLDALVPGIDPAAAAFIRRSLTGDGGDRPGLSDWQDAVDRWAAVHPVSELPESESTVIRERAAREARRIEQSLARRRWWRRSGWKSLTAVGAVVLVAAVVSAPIRRALETPVTAGLPPLEVARTYYEAMDRLDSETMDDCLDRRVETDDRRQVDMVFVTHKVRQGYEGIGEIPRADDWLRAGRPELPDGLSPWGVTDLELRELPDGRVEARYTFWAPMDDGRGGVDPVGISRIDRLSFSENRRSWVITDIDRTTGE